MEIFQYFSPQAVYNQMRCCSVIYFVQFFTLFVVFSKSSWENTLILDAIDSRPNKSMAVASLPLRLCLCKLASVAEGTAKDQLLNALDTKNNKSDTCYKSVSESLNNLKQSELILLNKIYVNYSREVDASSLADANSSYGVNVDYVGFNKPRAALAFINNGIASATYRRIRDILEIKDITEQTKMMMVTAAHLRATWDFPFDVKNTKPRKFMHLSNKVSEIPMMTQVKDYQVFENGNYMFLTANLRSFGASFSLIVPTQPKGLPALLANMRTNPNLLKDARAAMTIQVRKLVMPRLKIKSSLDLTDIFKNTTMTAILNSNSSSLKNILKEEFRSSNNMFVSKIKQKLFLELDELGVGRREKSPYSQNVASPPSEPIQSLREVAADRPFLFTFDIGELMPNKQRLIFMPHRLFSGVYYGPE